MSRPHKQRRICALPKAEGFMPASETSPLPPTVTMTLDEYEAIRLIDLEGLNQSDCALRMNVARTTAQAIYNSARRKLAQCLVGGQPLRVDGGDYVYCQGGAKGCSHDCEHANCAKAQRMRYHS